MAAFLFSSRIAGRVSSPAFPFLYHPLDGVPLFVAVEHQSIGKTGQQHFAPRLHLVDGSPGQLRLPAFQMSKGKLRQLNR